MRQRTARLLFFVLLPTFILVGCDAMLLMTYTVENRSKNEVKLFVPNFPDSSLSLFGKFTDTTLTLQPNDKIVVGFDSKIDFPWATKNIYRNKPGKCGIKKIETDTMIPLGCSKSEWKFKRGSSNLKIK